MNKIRVFRYLSIILLTIALVGSHATKVSAGGALVVTMVNEGPDANPGDGFCAISTGGCTLRAAIEEANAHVGAENIIFNLPGGGVHVMSITSGPLPIITEQLTLDGTSQPGCTVPCIVLSGAALGGSNTGLSIQANDSIIQGFIITSWSNHGITINGNGNIIQSNVVGFWPGNPTLLPNAYGISIVGGSNNQIGGVLASQRNVISGNTYFGIIMGSCVVSCAVSNTAILGNYIGTNQTGSAALANGASGIFVTNWVSNTVIGGRSAGARNVVSGNGQNGIDVSGATGTVIYGNFIGTNAAGNGPIGNQSSGISISAGARLTKVGGTLSGAGNRIAYNGEHGIVVFTASTIRNAIRRNSIYQNTLLGIDLNWNGVTPNDELDPDTGPNGLQNYPVLTSARSATRVIAGQLRSKVNQTYTLDFFSSPTCDPSHYGEGKTFLGSANVRTNATGVASFSITVPVAFTVGSKITATATDAAGNTSEFNLCRAAN